MVVHVVYRRKDNTSSSSSRFHGASIANPPGKHLVRLGSRSPSLRGGAAFPSSTSFSRPRDPTGGRDLRAASPPPPSCSIPTAGGCESTRVLRRHDDDEDWEMVVAVGDEAGVMKAAAADALEEVVGAPPTDDEVRAAVASIQQVFENVQSDAPELQALALPIAGLPSSGMFVNYFAEHSNGLDNQIFQLSNFGNSPSDTGSEEWTEPAALVLNSTALLTREHQNVLDAFHLLQVDSSVQKMVMALSTDKSVWDAVMKNEAVQDFRRSFHDAKETDLNESSNGSRGVIQWVLENTQAKIKEFLEQILKLVNMLFQAQSEDYDSYDDVVRMSFMLSVFVFIVVSVARMK